jgi:hypothetical protein
VAELYFLCRVTFHSAHFTNDRHCDWGHIPILLQYCGSCPCVRHGPYLPSISVSLQTPDRVEIATILAIPLLFQGSSPLSFTLSSQCLLWKFKKFDSERYHQSSHPRWDLAQTHKLRPLPPFHPVTASAGQWRGDVEVRSFLRDQAGSRSLVFDLSITHDRFGSSTRARRRVRSAATRTAESPVSGGR